MVTGLAAGVIDGASIEAASDAPRLLTAAARAVHRRAAAARRARGPTRAAVDASTPQTAPQCDSDCIHRVLLYAARTGAGSSHRDFELCA